MFVELGARTGHSTDAARVVEGLHERERAIEQAVAGEPRPRVLLVAALAPVYVAGPKSCAGDMVRITHGPLRGVKGYVEQDGSDLTFVVTIQLIQRSFAIRVDCNDLELAG